MADQRLTDKGLLASFADDDLVHVVDVSDVTANPAGTSKGGKWSLIKSTLKTYFDTIYNALGDFVTIGTAQTITGEKTFDKDVNITASKKLSVVSGAINLSESHLHADKLRMVGAGIGASDSSEYKHDLFTFTETSGNSVSVVRPNGLVGDNIQTLQNATGTIALLESFISQQNLSYGESYINKYKDRVVADGATYFPNDGGYDYANMREIGIDQDMSFMLTPSAVKAGTLYNVKPQGLDFTVVRAGTNATYIDEDGVRQTTLANVPRINYIDGEPSLLTEPSTTNLYATPDVLTTQNVTTTATPYTVSFEGTGTITFSGTHTGSLVGTGVNDRVEVTFTPTAGTLTSTVTGSVTFAQIEALSYQTSYVIGTRNADQITGAGDSTTFNDDEGTLVIEISALVNDLTVRRIAISDGTTNNMVRFFYDNVSNRINGYVHSGGALQANMFFVASDITSVNKIAIKWKLNDCALWVDGVEVATDVSATTPVGLNTLEFSDGTGGGRFYGNTKGIKVFNRVLTDVEIVKL